MVSGANRFGVACAAVAAWILLAFGAVGREPGQNLYPSEYKSIHQIELESHRYVPARAVRAARPLYALSQTAPLNRSHTVFGFYPYWASDFAQLRFRDLTHIAVFSVEADGSGQLTKLWRWPNAPLVRAAHDANVRVVLVCTLFVASELNSLLKSPSAQQTLIANLKQQVLDGGADGVNIDFEGIPAGNRENLVQFMSALAGELRAAVPGAHISIDTPAVDWRDVFDYAALADICDALMIMGYDYYWSGSSHAGPVAPLVRSTLWGEYCVQSTIVDYLSEVGPGRANKLILGVPYYGYDWPVTADVLHATTTGSSSSRIYKIASEQAALHGRRWESSASVPWYSYVQSGIRQTWYDDAESLSLKYDLVLQNGMQGIGIWALTYDEGKTELWDLIEQRFAATPVPEPPEITVPQTFFETSGIPLALQPRGTVPAADFEVAVGTTPGGTDISGFQSVGLRDQVFLRGLNLAAATTYYVTARSRGADGLLGAAGSPVSVTIDTSGPVQHRYLPRWINDDDYYSGLALVNPDAGARAFVLRGYAEGIPDPVVNAWVLKAAQQMAKVVSEESVFGAAGSGRSGWLEVAYQGGELHSMYMVGDKRVSNSLDGGPLLAAAAGNVLPRADGGSAVVELANPNPEMARIHLDLYSAAGPYAADLDLAPLALRVARVSDLFPAAYPAGLDYTAAQADPVQDSFLVVASNLPVACNSTLRRTQDGAVISGVPLADLPKEAFLPYVIQGAGYETEAALINPSREPLELELRLEGGVPYPPRTISIAPESGTVYLLADLFGLSGDGVVTGVLHLKVLAGSGVVGSAWVRSPDYRIMTALPLQIPQTAFLFPHYAQVQGLWTGLSIMNPGNLESEVTVEALDAGGRSQGVYRTTLMAGEQRVFLLYEKIPETSGLAGGRIEIRASGALLAAEIFGSDRLSFISVIPGR